MLVKTEKGRLELRPGHRSLGQRERAMLLVADGQQTEEQMASLFSGDGRRMLDQLLAQGYLQRKSGGRSEPPTRPVPAPRPAVTVAPPAPAVHGEGFTGTRSLASARMFLFDMSERLFAPRDKVLASRFRDALREARDTRAMLAVGRMMVAEVEVIAGAERADSISERLARLLPPEVMDLAA